MSLSIIINNKFFENKIKLIFFIFFISITCRSIIAFFFGDRALENEWEVLVYNLYTYGEFSMLKFDDLFVPNLWMPPVYGYFIYLHSLIFGLEDKLIVSVLITQIILSSLTVIIFFELLLNFFSRKFSLLGSIIFSLFPIIVFSASQISSVTIYLFFFTLFLLLVLKLPEDKSYKAIIIISIVSGILILTRRDFILIYFFSLLFSILFFQINFKKIIFLLFFTFITVSPHLIKNYLAFDRIIVHSGFGYNLWKAYNPTAKVEGTLEGIYDIELKKKIDDIDKDINFRINQDKIFLSSAKNFILNDPYRYGQLFLKRMFSFYFYDKDSSQKNYYNFLHIYPNLFIALLSLFGLIICSKKNKRLNYLILTFLILIFVYSCFAILPRYKIYILPFQIIFALSFIEYLKKLIKNN